MLNYSLPKYPRPKKIPTAIGFRYLSRTSLSIFSILAPATTIAALLFVSLPIPLRAQFAYVANENSGNISAYSIGPNGALTPVPDSPFAAWIAPFSVAAEPTGKFAYVVNNGDENVLAYSIGPDGALTPIPGSPFAAGFYPYSVAVDPPGKFLYVANSESASVSAYSIGSNGALTRVPGSPFAAGVYPYSVAVDPPGKFLYVANSESASVSAYSIGSNGALTRVPGSPFATGVGPISVAVDPTSKFAYVANFGSNSVSAYSIGSDGALTPIPVRPSRRGAIPLKWQLTPWPSSSTSQTGPMLPTASQPTASVPTEHSCPSRVRPFAAGSGPNDVAVDPTAKFAYVVNMGSNSVSAYSIGSNGALTPIPGSPFVTGSEPVSVAITRAVSK
jgi:6-phosphogluconolactonase